MTRWFLSLTSAIRRRGERVAAEIGVAILDAAEDLLGHHDVGAGAGRPAEHRVAVADAAAARLRGPWPRRRPSRRAGCSATRRSRDVREASLRRRIPRSARHWSPLPSCSRYRLRRRPRCCRPDSCSRRSRRAGNRRCRSTLLNRLFDLGLAGKAVAERDTGIGAGPGVQRRLFHRSGGRRRLFHDDVGCIGWDRAEQGHEPERCRSRPANLRLLFILVTP